MANEPCAQELFEKPLGNLEGLPVAAKLPGEEGLSYRHAGRTSLVGAFVTEEVVGFLQSHESSRSHEWSRQEVAVAVAFERFACPIVAQEERRHRFGMPAGARLAALEHYAGWGRWHLRCGAAASEL